MQWPEQKVDPVPPRLMTVRFEVNTARDVSNNSNFVIIHGSGTAPFERPTSEILFDEST